MIGRALLHERQSNGINMIVTTVAMNTTRHQEIKFEWLYFFYPGIFYSVLNKEWAKVLKEYARISMHYFTTD